MEDSTVYSHYTWTSAKEPECEIWYGTTAPPEFVECACFDLYDYEDWVGVMHAVLAMEMGLDEEVGA